MSDEINPPPVVLPALSLRPSEATLPKEKRYYAIVLVFSILVWLALLVSVIGIVYALLFAFFAWLGNGLLVAHLKSEAVEVGAGQLPRLHACFQELAGRLGVKPAPKLYVLQSGGSLNAFATRFAGRDFVVVYSDMLQALGEESAEMRFVLGHELGHLRSSHILKRLFLAPGLMLPLLGAAYLRACEASCDRYGVLACGSVQASARALVLLAGGPGQAARIDPAGFAAQHAEARGFFVSLHELSSGYPTLSQRTAKVLALEHPQVVHEAPRHPLAYVLGLLTPNSGLGGSGNLLVVVVLMGVLAAMAIPAFTKVREQSQLKLCQNNMRMLGAAYDQCYLETGVIPETYDAFVGEGKPLQAMPVCPEHGEYEVKALESGCTVECSKHGMYP